MKRSGFKKKTYQEALLARSQKPNFGSRRKKLRIKGISSTSQIKDEIQAVIRQIVIKRDKKCILYGIRCNHEYGVNDEGVVWQAEHLVERSNSATYADLKLVVLVCKNCHGWKHFKKSNHDQYDEWVKQVIGKDRVAHWERCVKQSWRPTKVDWKLTLVALKQELKNLSTE